MHLLVGIDTEGDNQWDAAARTHQTFENIYALPRLHALFARHGVRPTYVITHPVATDPRSADVLRRLVAGGDCEIGAHHHVWETPPCTPDDVRRHAYASTLPRRQFEEQLAALTEAIAGAVGTRPVSYRSGRFGFSAEHVSALEQHGYLVESSVAPLFYEAHKGGPEFVEAPLTPYFLAYDSATRAGSSNLLEVPVSAGLNRWLPKRAAICLRAGAAAVHDQAPAARPRAPAPALAAAVVFVARRHDGARPGPGARAANPCSTCSSTRARRSSAAAPTIEPKASSTPSAIGWRSS